MGATSARLRGAQAGDVITFVGWDGQTHDATVGLVSDNASFDAAELVFSVEQPSASRSPERPPCSSGIFLTPTEPGASSLRRSPIAGWGFRLSTDRPNPDFVSSAADLKARFGEFAYRETGQGDQIEIEPAWVEANIVTVDLPILGDIQVSPDGGAVPRGGGRRHHSGRSEPARSTRWTSNEPAGVSTPG